jgi:hypothetical protein
MKVDRMIQERSVGGRVLSAFEARTADAAVGAEERAWRTLQARLAARPPPRPWLVWPAAVLGAGAVAALVIALRPADPLLPAPSAAPRVAPAPLASTPPAPLEAPAPARATPVAPPPVALSAKLRPLSGRAMRLAGDVVLSLGQRTRARGSQQRATTQLVLEAGTLDLTVAPGQPRRVSVRAGPYRFVDLGTVFRVTHRGGRVSLRVDEGTVAVWRGPLLVATVNAGGHWSSRPARAPVPRATAVVVPLDPLRACAEAVASGSAADGVACYGRLAAGSGLLARTALYEQARLLAWQLRDLPGALTTLREHRRRFPDGALRAEVDLTLVEVLPRLGQFREALDESQALLARHPRHERTAELRLLRGNVLRESFRDYARAGREYAAVRAAVSAGDASAIADDAAFFEAVCLEADGSPGAADAYRRYLAGPAPRHAAQARARLSALIR